MFFKYPITFHGCNRQLSLALITACLASCANLKGAGYEAAQQDDVIFSQPMRPPKTLPDSDVYVPLDKTIEAQETIDVLTAPNINSNVAAVKAREAVMPELSSELVNRLTFNNMPIPVYINEIFGNQLGLNFVIEPSLKNAEDLVTMRLNQAVDQKNLYELATQTLKSYGVTTSIKNNAILFSFSENAGNETPLLISGRTLPEVPSNSRPLFYVYPLQSVTTPMIRSWLSQMFPKKELEIKEDIYQNALIFIGPNRAIEQAVAAAKLLDKPAMQDMFSRIIRPTLSDVNDLANNLENVLKAEGYAVRQSDGASAIRLLALSSVNQLVVFAKSENVLNHVIDWAKTLETEQHKKVDKGLFSYPVQSTQATHIVDILNSLGVADYKSNNSDKSNTTNSNNSAPRTSNYPDALEEDVKGRYAVDEQLNTILYSGSGKDWLQILPVIKKLDKPAASVMVEVILAEVQLNDSEDTGVEWLANSSLGRFGITSSTIGGLGLGASGFNMTLDSAGQTRAMLNLFYKNEKANIRSRPRLMVKSGGEASIDVGNEIPVITSNSQSTTDSDAVVLQTISYRKTGVLLEVKPTVHASGFVDIEITQELSEATETSSSDIDSPTILNRKISTTVTLRDGGSVLLGGLISSTTSTGTQGVPILGRLPMIGKLFSTDSNAQDRTELMIMIIPYILNSPDEAEQLTDELQKARIDKLSDGMVGKKRP
ncbi:type II and III secretion system protein [Paraglaciecola sp. T6c]|uniref:type II and III secretion system protein n=1 Tax=Pseudoalteromonas atlantica (strain T6c / ATCC BAA-1087) TaxID=3042615 RepID=UPI00005C5444|nr:type II and III secretion system protein [Paraglaciecola sp. T6c]ABG41742.1 type II and III secretion system protein [Paraglaciecola sp. T6c]